MEPRLLLSLLRFTLNHLVEIQNKTTCSSSRPLGVSSNLAKVKEKLTLLSQICDNAVSLGIGD